MKQGKKLLSLFLAAAVAVTGINFGGAIEVDAAAKEPAVVQDVTADDGDMAALARAVSASDGLTKASYQEQTLTAVNTASATAKEILENGAGAATKADVTAAISGLETAVNGIKDVSPSEGQAVVTPADATAENKQVLNASIAAAEALTESAYTADSWTVFQGVLNAAKAALTGNQKVVVLNTVKLNGAIVALVKKTETDDSVVTPDSVTVSPGEATVEKGGSQQFTATVNYKEGYVKVSGDDGVTWKVEGQGKDTTKIDATGKLVVAEDETAAKLTVTATSTKDTSKKDTATVTVVDKGEVPTTPVVKTVEVDPATARVEQGGNQQFTAIVSGDGLEEKDKGVTWSVAAKEGEKKAGTTITAGKLTVAADETAVLIVTATSKTDDTKSDTAEVTVVEKGKLPVVTGVTIDPKTATVEQAGEKEFTATVAGENLTEADQEVIWNVAAKEGEKKAGTTITAGKLTVAADETAVLIVTATSKTDDTKSDTAEVTVVEKGKLPVVTGVTIDPKTATVEQAGEKEFTATVAGENLTEADQEVIWNVAAKEGEKKAGTTITAGKLTVAADETAVLIVTATSKTDDTKSDTAEVTVVEKGKLPVVTGVAVTPKTATVEKGKTQKFSAAVAGENLTEADKAVTWTVTGTTNANTKIAADGTLTVAANETAATLTVTATSKTDNTKKGSATVTVKTPSVTVTVNKTDLKKAIDAAAKLKKSKYTAKTWKTFNNALTAARNTYSNANATQAQVNAARTTLLNAQKKLIFKVTKVTITGSKQMAAGKKITLKATVKPAKQVTKKVKWAVDKKSKKYASVNSKGVVTAKKNAGGKTIKVTASATDDSKKKATFSIKVMKKAVSKITLKAGKKKVKAGKKITVKATVKPSKNASKLVTWSLDKTCVKKKYATISSKGVVKTTKKGKNKTITVTATATDGSKKKAKIKIKITK